MTIRYDRRGQPPDLPDLNLWVVVVLLALAVLAVLRRWVIQ